MSPEQKAVDILDRIGFTGETPLYAQLLASIATAIRYERDLFLATNQKLRSNWHDSPDAIAYADDLTIQLMSQWGGRVEPPL